MQRHHLCSLSCPPNCRMSQVYQPLSGTQNRHGSKCKIASIDGTSFLASNSGVATYLHQKLWKLNSEVIQIFFSKKIRFCSEKWLVYLVHTWKCRNYVLTKYILCCFVIIIYLSISVLDWCPNYLCLSHKYLNVSRYYQTQYLPMKCSSFCSGRGWSDCLCSSSSRPCCITRTSFDFGWLGKGGTKRASDSEQSPRESRVVTEWQFHDAICWRF